MEALQNAIGHPESAPSVLKHAIYKQTKEISSPSRIQLQRLVQEAAVLAGVKPAANTPNGASVALSAALLQIRGSLDKKDPFEDFIWDLEDCMHTNSSGDSAAATLDLKLPSSTSSSIVGAAADVHNHLAQAFLQQDGVISESTAAALASLFASRSIGALFQDCQDTVDAAAETSLPVSQVAVSAPGGSTEGLVYSTTEHDPSFSWAWAQDRPAVLTVTLSPPAAVSSLTLVWGKGHRTVMRPLQVSVQVNGSTPGTYIPACDFVAVDGTAACSRICLASVEPVSSLKIHMHGSLPACISSDIALNGLQVNAVNPQLLESPSSAVSGGAARPGTARILGMLLQRAANEPALQEAALCAALATASPAALLQLAASALQHPGQVAPGHSARLTVVGEFLQSDDSLSKCAAARHAALLAVTAAGKDSSSWTLHPCAMNAKFALPSDNYYASSYTFSAGDTELMSKETYSAGIAAVIKHVFAADRITEVDVEVLVVSEDARKSVFVLDQSPAMVNPDGMPKTRGDWAYANKMHTWSAHKGFVFDGPGHEDISGSDKPSRKVPLTVGTHRIRIDPRAGTAHVSTDGGTPQLLFDQLQPNRATRMYFSPLGMHVRVLRVASTPAIAPVALPPSLGHVATALTAPVRDDQDAPACDPCTAALSVVKGLARLSFAYHGGAGFKPLPPLVPGASICSGLPREEPFAFRCSADTFQSARDAVCALLPAMFDAANDDARNSAAAGVCGILCIVRAALARATAGRFDPLAVGIVKPHLEGDEAALHPGLVDLQYIVQSGVLGLACSLPVSPSVALLSGRLQTQRTETGLAPELLTMATQYMNDALDFVFRSVTSQLQLLSALVSPAPSTASDAGVTARPTAAEAALVQQFMSKLSTDAGVASLLPTPGADQKALAGSMQCVLSLVSSLLLASGDMATSLLGSSGDAAAPNALATRFLGKLLHAVCLAAADAVTEAAETQCSETASGTLDAVLGPQWNNASTLNTDPRTIMMAELAMLVLASSRSILSSALHTLQAKSAPLAVVHAAVHSSAVGQLLPLLAAHLTCRELRHLPLVTAQLAAPLINALQLAGAVSTLLEGGTAVPPSTGTAPPTLEDSTTPWLKAMGHRATVVPRGAGARPVLHVGEKAPLTTRAAQEVQAAEHVSGKRKGQAAIFPSKADVVPEAYVPALFQGHLAMQGRQVSAWAWMLDAALAAAVGIVGETTLNIGSAGKKKDGSGSDGGDDDDDNASGSASDGGSGDGGDDDNASGSGGDSASDLAVPVADVGDCLLLPREDTSTPPPPVGDGNLESNEEEGGEGGAAESKEEEGGDGGAAESKEDAPAGPKTPPSAVGVAGTVVGYGVSAAGAFFILLPERNPKGTPKGNQAMPAPQQCIVVFAEQCELKFQEAPASTSDFGPSQVQATDAILEDGTVLSVPAVALTHAVTAVSHISAMRAMKELAPPQPPAPQPGTAPPLQAPWLLARASLVQGAAHAAPLASCLGGGSGAAWTPSIGLQLLPLAVAVPGLALQDPSFGLQLPSVLLGKEAKDSQTSEAPLLKAFQSAVEGRIAAALRSLLHSAAGNKVAATLKLALQKQLSGLVGLSWLQRLQRLLACAVSRHAAQLARGPHISHEESELTPLLHSKLVQGGVFHLPPGESAAEVILNLPAALNVLQQRPVEAPLQAPPPAQQLLLMMQRKTDSAEVNAPGAVVMPGDSADGLLASLAGGTAPEQNRTAVHGWLSTLNLPTSRAKKMKLAKQRKFPHLELPLWLAAVKLCGRAATTAAAQAVQAAVTGDTAAATAALPGPLAGMWEHVRAQRSYLIAQAVALEAGVAASGPLAVEEGGAVKEVGAPVTEVTSSTDALGAGAPAAAAGVTEHSVPDAETADAASDADSDGESESAGGSGSESESDSDSEHEESEEDDDDDMPRASAADTAASAAADTAAASAAGRAWRFAGPRRAVHAQRADSFIALEQQLLRRVHLVLCLGTADSLAGTGTELSDDSAGAVVGDALGSLHGRFGTGGVREAIPFGSVATSSGTGVGGAGDEGADDDDVPPPPPGPSSLSQLRHQASWTREGGTTALEDEGGDDTIIPPPPAPGAPVGAQLGVVSPSKASTAMARVLAFAKLGVSPHLVQRLLYVQRLRAQARAFALNALETCLGSLRYDLGSEGASGEMACLLRSDLLRHARAGLRGTTEKQLLLYSTESVSAAAAAAADVARRQLEGSSSGDAAVLPPPRDVDVLLDDAGAVQDSPFATWQLAHHFSHGIVAAGPDAVADLRAAFTSLAVQVAGTLRQLLAHTATASAAALQAQCSWLLALQWRRHDLPLLLRLQLPALLRFAAALVAAGGKGGSVSQPLPGTWAPWDPVQVRAGLLSGALRKADVIAHMQAAPAAYLAACGVPGGADGAAWCRAAGLHPDPKQAAAATGAAKVAHLALMFGKGEHLPGTRSAISVLKSPTYRTAVRAACRRLQEHMQAYTDKYGPLVRENYNVKPPSPLPLPLQLEIQAAPLGSAPSVTTPQGALVGPVNMKGNNRFDFQFKAGVPGLGEPTAIEPNCVVTRVTPGLLAMGPRMIHGIPKNEYCMDGHSSFTITVNAPVRVWLAPRLYHYTDPDQVDLALQNIGFVQDPAVAFHSNYEGGSPSGEQTHPLFACRWLLVPDADSGEAFVTISCSNPLQGNARNCGISNLDMLTVFLEHIDMTQVRIGRGAESVLAPDEAALLHEHWAAQQGALHVDAAYATTALSAEMAPLLGELPRRMADDTREHCRLRLGAGTQVAARAVRSTLAAAAAATGSGSATASGTLASYEMQSPPALARGGVPDAALIVLSHVLLGAQMVDNKATLDIEDAVGGTADTPVPGIASSVLQLARLASTANSEQDLLQSAEDELRHEALQHLAGTLDAALLGLETAQEALVHERLLLARLADLALLAASPVVRSAVSDEAWLKRLLQAFASGSLRVRRAVLAVLSACASQLRPSFWGAVLQKHWPAPADVQLWRRVYQGSEDTAVGDSLLTTASSVAIGWLLWMAAVPTLQAWGVPCTQACPPAASPDRCASDTPQVQLAMSELAVDMLRSLGSATGSPWRKHVLSLLPAALSSCAALLASGVAPGANTAAEWAAVIASLAILAGQRTAVQPGTHVLMQKSNTHGVVLAAVPIGLSGSGDAGFAATPGVTAELLAAAQGTADVAAGTPCALVVPDVHLPLSSPPLLLPLADLTPQYTLPPSPSLLRLDAASSASLQALCALAPGVSPMASLCCSSAHSVVALLLSDPGSARELMLHCMAGAQASNGEGGGVPPLLQALFDTALAPAPQGAAALQTMPVAELHAHAARMQLLCVQAGGVTPSHFAGDTPTHDAPSAEPLGSADSAARQLAQLATACSQPVFVVEAALGACGKTDPADLSAWLSSPAGSDCRGASVRGTWTAAAMAFDAARPMLGALLAETVLSALELHLQPAFVAVSLQLSAEGAVVVAECTDAQGDSVAIAAVPMQPTAPITVGAPVQLSASTQHCTVLLLRAEDRSVAELRLSSTPAGATVELQAQGTQARLQLGGLILPAQYSSVVPLLLGAMPKVEDSGKQLCLPAPDTPAFAVAAQQAHSKLQRPPEAGDANVVHVPVLGAAAQQLLLARGLLSWVSSDRLLAGLPAWRERGSTQAAPGLLSTSDSNDMRVLEIAAACSALGLLDFGAAFSAASPTPADRSSSSSSSSSGLPPLMTTEPLVSTAVSTPTLLQSTLSVKTDASLTGNEAVQGVAGAKWTLRTRNFQGCAVNYGLGVAQCPEDATVGKAGDVFACQPRHSCLMHGGRAEYLSSVPEIPESSELRDIEMGVMRCGEDKLSFILEGVEVGAHSRLTCNLQAGLYPVVSVPRGVDTSIALVEVVLQTDWTKYLETHPRANLNDSSVWSSLAKRGADIPFHMPKGLQLMGNEQSCRAGDSNPDSNQPRTGVPMCTVSEDGLTAVSTVSRGNAVGEISALLFKPATGGIDWSPYTPQQVLQHPSMARFVPLWNAASNAAAARAGMLQVGGSTEDVHRFTVAAQEVILAQQQAKQQAVLATMASDGVPAASPVAVSAAAATEFSGTRPKAPPAGGAAAGEEDTSDDEEDATAKEVQPVSATGSPVNPILAPGAAAGGEIFRGQPAPSDAVALPVDLPPCSAVAQPHHHSVAHSTGAASNDVMSHKKLLDTRRAALEVAAPGLDSDVAEAILHREFSFSRSMQLQLGRKAGVLCVQLGVADVELPSSGKAVGKTSKSQAVPVHPLTLGYAVQWTVEGDGNTLLQLPAITAVGAVHSVMLPVFAVSTLTLKATVTAALGGEAPNMTEDDPNAAQLFSKYLATLPDIIPERLAPLAWGFQLAGQGATDVSGSHRVLYLPQGLLAPGQGGPIDAGQWADTSKGRACVALGALLDGNTLEHNTESEQLPVPVSVAPATQALQIVQLQDAESGVQYTVPSTAAQLHVIKQLGGQPAEGGPTAAAAFVGAASHAYARLASKAAQGSVLSAMAAIATAAAVPGPQQAALGDLLQTLSSSAQFLHVLQWVASSDPALASGEFQAEQGDSEEHTPLQVVARVLTNCVTRQRNTAQAEQGNGVAAVLLKEALGQLVRSGEATGAVGLAIQAPCVQASHALHRTVSVPHAHAHTVAFPTAQQQLPAGAVLALLVTAPTSDAFQVTDEDGQFVSQVLAAFDHAGTLLFLGDDVTAGFGWQGGPAGKAPEVKEDGATLVPAPTVQLHWRSIVLPPGAGVHLCVSVPSVPPKAPKEGGATDLDLAAPEEAETKEEETDKKEETDTSSGAEGATESKEAAPVAQLVEAAAAAGAAVSTAVQVSLNVTPVYAAWQGEAAVDAVPSPAWGVWLLSLLAHLPAGCLPAKVPAGHLGMHSNRVLGAMLALGRNMALPSALRASLAHAASLVLGSAHLFSPAPALAGLASLPAHVDAALVAVMETATAAACAPRSNFASKRVGQGWQATANAHIGDGLSDAAACTLRLVATAAGGHCASGAQLPDFAPASTGGFLPAGVRAGLDLAISVQVATRALQAQLAQAAAQSNAALRAIALAAGCTPALPTSAADGDAGSLLVLSEMSRAPAVAAQTPAPEEEAVAHSTAGADSTAGANESKAQGDGKPEPEAITETLPLPSFCQALAAVQGPDAVSHVAAASPLAWVAAPSSRAPCHLPSVQLAGELQTIKEQKQVLGAAARAIRKGPKKKAAAAAAAAAVKQLTRVNAATKAVQGLEKAISAEEQPPQGELPALNSEQWIPAVMLRQLLLALPQGAALPPVEAGQEGTWSTVPGHDAVAVGDVSDEEQARIVQAWAFLLAQPELLLCFGDQLQHMPRVAVTDVLQLMLCSGATVDSFAQACACILLAARGATHVDALDVCFHLLSCAGHAGLTALRSDVQAAVLSALQSKQPATPVEDVGSLVQAVDGGDAAAAAMQLLTDTVQPAAALLQERLAADSTLPKLTKPWAQTEETTAGSKGVRTVRNAVHISVQQYRAPAVACSLALLGKVAELADAAKTHHTKGTEGEGMLLPAVQLSDDELWQLQQTRTGNVAVVSAALPAPIAAATQPPTHTGAGGDNDDDAPHRILRRACVATSWLCTADVLACEHLEHTLSNAAKAAATRAKGMAVLWAAEETNRRIQLLTGSSSSAKDADVAHEARGAVAASGAVLPLTGKWVVLAQDCAEDAAQMRQLLRQCVKQAAAGIIICTGGAVLAPHQDAGVSVTAALAHSAEEASPLSVSASALVQSVKRPSEQLDWRQYAKQWVDMDSTLVCMASPASADCLLAALQQSLLQSPLLHADDADAADGQMSGGAGGFAAVAMGAMQAVRGAVARLQSKRAQRLLQDAENSTGTSGSRLQQWAAARGAVAAGGASSPSAAIPPVAVSLTSLPAGDAGVLQPIVPGRIIGRTLRVVPTDLVMGAAELADSFVSSTEAPASIQAAAWLLAQGLATHLESEHPYRAGERFSREVVIPGAAALVVTVNSNTSFGSGASFTLQAPLPLLRQGRAVTSLKPLSSRPAHVVLDAQNMPVDGQTWVVAGDKVHLAFCAGKENAGDDWGVAACVSPLTVVTQHMRGPSLSAASALALARQPGELGRCLAAGAEQVLSVAAAAGLAGLGSARWSQSMDVQLVQLLEDQANAATALQKASVPPGANKGLHGYVMGYPRNEDCIILPEGLLPHAMYVPAGQQHKYPDLLHVPSSVLAARAAALQHFNLLVPLVLGIQRSHGALPWSGVAKVIAAQHCMFPSVRRTILSSMIRIQQASDRFLMHVHKIQALRNASTDQTHVALVASEKMRGACCVLGQVLPRSPCPAEQYSAEAMTIPACQLSNFKATKSEEEGDTSIHTSKNIFVQLYEAWQPLSPLTLRSGGSKQTQQLFDEPCAIANIRFEGESGIDEGGVYREGLTRAVESLFSGDFALLSLTQNATDATGDSTPLYLPAVDAVDDRAMSMFEFIGRWMAMSMRTVADLPFEFPLVVYHCILGGMGGLAEVAEVSKPRFDFIQKLNKFVEENSQADDESFQAAFGSSSGLLTFADAMSPSAPERELLQAKQQLVGIAAKDEFVQQYIAALWAPVRLQLGAIARGFHSVYPKDVLDSVSAMKLRELVAGKATVDIELLKRHTTYSDYEETDQQVVWFWEVLHEMSDEERSMYVRFAWGRSRIPSTDASFTTEHEVEKARGSAEALPVAHTCFFVSPLHSRL